jgi:aryl-alcohol dehydrogenase-like predicted oxidoreductase
VQRLYGLLLHRPSDLFGPQGGELLRALTALKEAGLVGKVGASVYAPDELERLRNALSLDIVQAPYSVLDRRFANSGWFERLHEAGTEIHVRSVFLQGLLLQPEDQVPSAFARWHLIWRQWREWVDNSGTDQLGAALGFVLRNSKVARVVVGAESSRQLAQIIAGARALATDVPPQLAVEDLQLINPVNWTVK